MIRSQSHKVNNFSSNCSDELSQHLHAQKGDESTKPPDESTKLSVEKDRASKIVVLTNEAVAQIHAERKNETLFYWKLDVTVSKFLRFIK